MAVNAVQSPDATVEFRQRTLVDNVGHRLDAATGIERIVLDAPLMEARRTPAMTSAVAVEWDPIWAHQIKPRRSNRWVRDKETVLDNLIRPIFFPVGHVRLKSGLSNASHTGCLDRRRSLGGLHMSSKRWEIRICLNLHDHPGDRLLAAKAGWNDVT